MFKSFGSLLKYTLAADSIPTALFTQSYLFKYISIISSFVYRLSNFAAITHSLSFCFTLSTPEAGVFVNNILANCCVIVLAPPACPFPETTPKTALKRALISIPECSLNLMSSVASRAFMKLCGISSLFAVVLLSIKNLPITTLSEEMTSVAKLFFGFSS